MMNKFLFISRGQATRIANLLNGIANAHAGGVGLPNNESAKLCRITPKSLVNSLNGPRMAIIEVLLHFTN